MTHSHDAVIVGAGPTGMMLAAELKIAGIDAAVVERRTTPELTGARAGAGGLHARTIEVLDQRGVVGRFLAEGRPAQVIGFHSVRLDISDFPTRYPYGLALWQRHFERILAGWVDELGVTIYRGVDATGFAWDDAGVDAHLSDGTHLRARYVVGCDGGRSNVRKAAGIDFVGVDASRSWLIAQARMRDEPPFGFKEDAVGKHAIGKAATEGMVGIVLTEPGVRPDGARTEGDLRERLVAVYGTDFGVHDPTYISSFTDAVRQATRYRAGRVLIAGDAAHIHPPLGGFGLNLGVQDAVNLGWKLAQVLRGTSDEALLDTYFAERGPVAARILKHTMAMVAVTRTDERSKALGDYVVDFLASDGPRKRIAGEASGLAIHYDLGEGHPLLGRRMPDLDLETSAGPVRLFTLLHEARPVLLNLGAPGAVTAGAWSDRVIPVDARFSGRWELPVLGEVSAPAAVLVRPDGHVAWVGDGTSTGLDGALLRWFGRAVRV